MRDTVIFAGGSFGGNRGLRPVPPEKGVFPLDHMHLCDLVFLFRALLFSPRICGFWNSFEGFFVFIACFVMHGLHCRRRKNTSIVLKRLVTNLKNAGTYQKNTFNVVWKSKTVEISIVCFCINKCWFALCILDSLTFVCGNLGYCYLSILMFYTPIHHY